MGCDTGATTANTLSTIILPAKDSPVVSHLTLPTWRSDKSRLAPRVVYGCHEYRGKDPGVSGASADGVKGVIFPRLRPEMAV